MHQKSLDNYLNLPELQNTHFEVLLMTIKDTPALHKKICQSSNGQIYLLNSSITLSKFGHKMHISIRESKHLEIFIRKRS